MPPKSTDFYSQRSNTMQSSYDDRPDEFEPYTKNAYEKKLADPKVKSVAVHKPGVKFFTSVGVAMEVGQDGVVRELTANQRKRLRKELKRCEK